MAVKSDYLLTSLNKDAPQSVEGARGAGVADGAEKGASEAQQAAKQHPAALASLAVFERALERGLVWALVLPVGRYMQCRRGSETVRAAAGKDHYRVRLWAGAHCFLFDSATCSFPAFAISAEEPVL